jgi:signal transduction histidine kinase
MCWRFSAGYSAGMTASWLRRLTASPWLDAAIGVTVIVATWIELWAPARHIGAGRLAGLMILAVLIGIPLAWRRRAPLAVLTVVLAANVASGMLAGQLGNAQGPAAAFLAILLAVFSTGAYAQGRRILAGGVVLAAGLGTAVVYGSVSGRGTDYGFWVAAGIFWAMGLLFRQRLLRVAELQAHADRLQLEQAEKARRAVIEERSRIARELHDVIAHSVSVMVIQAGAARHTLDPGDTEMRESLQAIETAGREATAELRRLLGILRRPDDEPALAPVPGLARVSVLVEQIREAGLPTELRIEGEPADIAPGVDLTAYRIIQEALTNSRRPDQGRAPGRRVARRVTRMPLLDAGHPRRNRHRPAPRLRPCGRPERHDHQHRRLQDCADKRAAHPGTAQPHASASQQRWAGLPAARTALANPDHPDC